MIHSGRLRRIAWRTTDAGEARAHLPGWTRDFSRRRLILLGLVALGVPPSAAGQPPPHRLRRIGFITLASLTDPRIEAFRKGMRELGYVEGESILIDWRSADGSAARLSALADGIVRLKPALIVAAQTQAISATKRATSVIPIVFVATPDPVSSGFVNTLSRPGGNLTGLSTSAVDIGSKQIEILKLALPKCSRVAFLANPTNNASVVVRKVIATTALEMKLQVISLDAQDLGEIERALPEARHAGADAAIFAVDGFFIQVRSQIAELALRHRLPTMFTQREHAMAGGMLSYGPSLSAQYHRAAYYVDRILKGAKVADLPVEQPSVFELVVNLKTAKELGITIPRSLLLRADHVIE
jgi:putative ABC transport system substrate-binding protein